MMAAAMIEFLIHDVCRDGGNIAVTGAVNEGVVEIGSQFDVVRHESDIREPPIGTEVEVRLEVMRIMAYRHSLDRLPCGMTGKLLLQGDDKGESKHGVMLVSKGASTTSCR